jgi:hypothetical protein
VPRQGFGERRVVICLRGGRRATRGGAVGVVVGDEPAAIFQASDFGRSCGDRAVPAGRPGRHHDRHGKVRRRKRHPEAAAATTAAATTTATISAGGRLQQDDGTEGEDVDAVISAAAPDAAAEEVAADRAPDVLGDDAAAAAAVPREPGIREDTTDHDHDTANSNDDDDVVLEPFPTLYWLTHPLLRILVSQLEVEGWGRQLEERLRNDIMAQQSMQRAHAHYGSYRYTLLSSEDRQLLKQRNWETALCPDTRGVAGIMFAEGEVGSGSGSKRGTTSSLSSRICSVKCLHAHAAHYLSAHRCNTTTAATTSDRNSTSQGTEGCDPAMDNGGDDNVVGMWVMELIQERLLLVDDDMAAAPAAAAAAAADEGTVHEPGTVPP